MAAPDPYGAYARPVAPAPRKPTVKERQTGAQIEQTGASTAQAEATTTRTRALLPSEVAKAEAEARKAKTEADEAERLAGRTKPTAAEAADTARITGDMGAAIDTINLLTKQFNDNLAGAGLVKSTLEYFPSQEKRAIDATAAGLGDVGMSIFKVPGSGAQSDKDAARFVRANEPSTWDADYEFLGKIYNLRRRLDGKARSMGLPPIQWTEPSDVAARQYLELPEAERAKIGAREVGTFKDVPPELLVPPTAPALERTPAEASALNAAMNVAAPLVAAERGAEEKAIPIPEEMQAEMQDWFAQHPRGTASLKEYSDFRRGLDMKYGPKYGFGVGDYENDPTSIEFLNNYNDPKRPVNTAIPPVGAEDTRNALERAAGAAVMSPPGTAAAAALSGAGLNLMDALLPEEMAAVRELNPTAAAIGDIGGALTGGAALKKVGTKVAQKALSRAPGAYSALMSSGRGATMARNALSDILQGATYGGAVEGDAGMGAAGGFAGNVLGVVGGGAGKRLLGGLARLPEAEALMRQYGLEDLTVGQQAGGGFRALEDTATSIPGIGDIINARRGESMLGLNEAAFRRAAGETIGAGEPALDALEQARRKAYTDALAGKYFDLDNPVFKTEMAQALGRRTGLTDELGKEFDVAVKRSVEGTPIGYTGTMTGEEYQQAQRSLSGYKAARQKPGFEKDYRDALGEVGKALRAEVERQSPDLVPLLSEADIMYRSEKVLQDAIARARKDTTGLGGDIFTPGQLTDAVYQSGRRYPGTPQLQELARLAQSVIPAKMPDSGTARRGALMALGAVGLGGAAGGGMGYATDSEAPLSDAATGATVPGSILAALALGGSRRGQRALSKVLFDRPQVLKQAGDIMRKAAPFAGTAAIPALVPDTRYPAQTGPETEPLAVKPPALNGLPADLSVKAAPKETTIEIGGRRVRYDPKTDKYYDAATGEVVLGLAKGGRARRKFAVAR